MKRGHILVEINHEEVEAPGACLKAILIVANNIVIVSRSFRGEGTDLAIATSISGQKENGSAVQLHCQHESLDEEVTKLTPTSSWLYASTPSSR